MIEVTLEFSFDSFLVNSVGGGGEMVGKMPSKALKFICENIFSAKQLTEHAPTADFEFLGSTSQGAAKAETDQGFDDHLFSYLTGHTTVDISSVMVSSEGAGYSTMPKGVSTGEIGRIKLTTLPAQSRVDVELVIKDDQFDAMWKLAAEQEVQQVMATLVCFKIKQGNPPPITDTNIVAGIVSASLQLMPRSRS